MFHHTRPIVVHPRHIVRNRFIRRVHPVIHPIVHVDRIHIEDVPRHIIRPIRRREIIEHRRPFRRW